MTTSTPSLSVIVPVHNEEAILSQQVAAMRSALGSLGHVYEILLVENGSTDATLNECESLGRVHSDVRVLAISTADYGVALRAGILDARNDLVVIFNVEFWSIHFVAQAVEALKIYRLVIGSKAAPGARDERPRFRRAITRSYNQFLRVIWGFGGTDTHGMKAFHREALSPVVADCRCTGFIFDTEFVLRCERAGISRIELPTDVRELRPPSRLSLLKRVPDVVRNLIVLYTSLR